MSEHQHSMERFRILVIGNANAGKTTILEKVCRANGRPPICLDDKGNEIDSVLQPSPSRGQHNIEHQFQYPTAHGFIFHDSCGFEAGGADELKKVKEFVQSRAEKKELKDQLHVIWYCLTTSNDRGLTEAEMSLFESGTGDVPVIAIFTKMDALDEEARNQLVQEKVSFRKIKEQVPIRAKAIFEMKYLRQLQQVKHQPRYIVQFRDMNKKDSDCGELITRTSQALNNKALKLFCLSIFRSDFCTKDIISQITTVCSHGISSHGIDHFAPEFGKLIKCDPQTIELDVADWEQTLPPLLDALEKLLSQPNIGCIMDGYCQQCRFFQITYDGLARFKLLRESEDPVIDKCLRSLKEIILYGKPGHQKFNTNFRPVIFGLVAIAGIVMAILAHWR